MAPNCRVPLSTPSFDREAVLQRVEDSYPPNPFDSLVGVIGRPGTEIAHDAISRLSEQSDIRGFCIDFPIYTAEPSAVSLW